MVHHARLWRLLTSLLVGTIGCTDDTGTGGSGGGQHGGGGAGGGTSFSWAGHRVLRLGFTPATDDPYHCLGDDSVAVTWGVVLDVTADATDAAGWLAGTEMVIDASSLRITAGSTAVQGDALGPTLSLAPLTATLSPVDEVSFSFLELEAIAGDEVTGRAEGTWVVFMGGDFLCELPFTASVAGGLDTEAPSAWPPQLGVSPLLPFEPIELVLTEPIAATGVLVDARIGGDIVAAHLALQPDLGREGFAQALSVASPTSWPAGEALSATLSGLRDAAGNAAVVELPTFELAAPPASAQNLGFENGLDGWLTDPIAPTQPGVFGEVFPATSFEGTDENGDPFLLTPPEGQIMVVVGSGGRLIGHLEPPSDATAVVLSLGVLDFDVPSLLADGQGCRLDLVSTNGEVVASSESNGALFPLAAPTWSGFAEPTLVLPTTPRGGLWLLVTTVGFAPPVHMPQLLVDNVRYLQGARANTTSP